MSRTALPFISGDISALARSLKDQLGKLEHLPGHVELLNMLARSLGFRNFQHFRSQKVGLDQTDDPMPDLIDMARVNGLMRFFDTEMRLSRWPSKLSHQQSCLWVLWSRLPPKQVLSEAQINRLLQAGHAFGDHALLRRWLCDYGMVIRTVDGREYRRVERRPPSEARMLIHCVHRRSCDQSARQSSSADTGGAHVRAG